jgi:hypothetical protein
VFVVAPGSNAGGGISDYYVADADGHVWETLLHDGIPRATLGAWPLYYALANCSGAAYVPANFPAGYVFTIIGDTGTLRTIPAAPTLTSLQVASQLGSGGCSNGTFTSVAVPLAETVPSAPIVQPAKLFEPPAHVVLIH